MIVKEDFSTLEGGDMVATTIVDAWCNQLNKMVANKEEDRRFFFDLTHLVKSDDMLILI